ncbi:MAG: undecaprenyldiphospho-muramoylpentapeptide beta-N-acetylglucosaminyltransferase [Candidatus Hydrogenedentes bacterium]|nr:undecaprenyldiphospho-muramoylpentapeptide beta-N-acetylglucosaminyltransferase [Candidatus Hydrogenedentota bacterium]
MKLVITGGGTGGHTSPAVAVYEELLRRDPRLSVLWIGRAGAIENRICAAKGIPFRSLPVEGWPRKKILRRGFVAAKLAWSMARAWVYLRNFEPDVVFGVGGYVSLPAMLLAPRMGIPTVLHEQNRLLGVTNRVAAKNASRIFLSFEDTVGAFPRERARVVGNPVRSAFASPLDKKAAIEQFSLDPNIPILLVCGGSQGARSINDAVTGMLSALAPNEVQLIWMTGNADAAPARETARSARTPVHVYAFIEDMAAACAAADLIITRSGASTTAEIALMRKPSILIPYPHATDNHQAHNALSFVDAGASIVLEDAALSPEILLQQVRGLLNDPDRVRAMGDAAGTLATPGAADSIAAEILALAFLERVPV